jgi:dolichyl-phosphate beta-glucosyltransferase
MNRDLAKTTLVVPCYNERERLQPDAFLDVLEPQPTLHFHFVDDGSTDHTWEILEELKAKAPTRVTTQRLSQNRGKAEAIRRGIQDVLRNQGESDRALQFLGYWDADLSAPLVALPLFEEIFESKPECRLVMGSRVRLLGKSIIRRPLRHYLGRILSTLASLALDLAVYDTQCGAKLFRIDQDLEKVFADPFSDPWLFDVELLARLKALWGWETESRIIELPLPSWEHVGGSKVRMWHGLRALVCLVSIWIRSSRGTTLPAEYTEKPNF